MTRLVYPDGAAPQSPAIQKLRDRTYRPQEPMGVRAEGRRVRSRIQEFDHRLDLWWDANRGCWKVVEWVDPWGMWTLACHWRSDTGGYRRLDAAAMKRKLASIRWDKYGQRKGDGVLKEIEEDLEGEATRAREKEEREEHEAMLDYAHDLGARTVGSRQTFGPGGHRSRTMASGKVERGRTWRPGVGDSS